MKISRREVVAGGSLILSFFSCGGECCGANALTEETRGCVLSTGDYKAVRSQATSNIAPAGKDDPIWKSGDRMFDYALAQTLGKLVAAFEVTPGFAYYDGPRSRNAFATDRIELKRSDGSVFFGMNLLREVLEYPESPEVAVAAICAHEFGHIVQFKRKLFSIVDAGQDTVKRSELQADYLAGYFSGLRKLRLPTYPAAVAALSLFKVGDKAFKDPNHHGTQEERGGAAVRGFEAAYREKKSLDEAIEQSTRYVMTF